MRTISLEELVERASLQTRVDRKYIVPRAEIGELVESLEAEARVLEILGQTDFGYESVYFDTPELASYLGAAHRRRRRFKVRTRTYTDSGDCFLEVKTEGARSATVKERLRHALSATRLGLTASSTRSPCSTRPASGPTSVSSTPCSARTTGE